MYENPVCNKLLNVQHQVILYYSTLISELHRKGELDSSRLKKNHEKKQFLLEKLFSVVGGKWSKYKFWLTTQNRHLKFSTTIHAWWRYELWEAILSKLAFDQAGIGEGRQLGFSFLKSGFLKK